MRKKNSYFRVRKKFTARKKFLEMQMEALALSISTYPSASVKPSKLSWILEEHREKQKNPKSN